MRSSLIPEVHPEKIRRERFGDYAVRFLFGAAISLVSGVIGLKYGPKIGGVFLAFPAILPASLTLIEKKEGRVQAATDSVGAALGAIGMIAFAVVVSQYVTRWGVLQSLVVALIVWLAVAAGLYFLVASVYRRERP